MSDAITETQFKDYVEQRTKVAQIAWEEIQAVMKQHKVALVANNGTIEVTPEEFLNKTTTT